MPATTPTGLLGPYRVLDCTDERGAIAGMVLTQLGADVVRVEPPGGARIRRVPPFVEAPDSSGVERSLVHLIADRGKRSLVAEPGDLLELVRDADALLTSGGPRELAQQGIPAFADLQRVNPGLVIANVSGFGLTGPKADWLDGDLVCGAAGLQLSLTGDADRPPLRCAVPQVFGSAAADAVLGVLLALAERERSGRGQVVDCAAQESWVWASFYLSYATPWSAPVSQRNGMSPRTGKSTVRFEFPAADGDVTITLLFGAAVGPYTNRLVAWMVEEGECPEEIAQTDWETFDIRTDPGRQVRLNDAVAAFTARRTKATLLEGSRTRRLLLAPAFTLADVLDAEQFAQRDLWRSVTIAPDRSVRVPGPIARSWPTALRELPAAPALGDTARDDLRRSAGSTAAPTAAGVAPDRLPLEGLRVLDLTTSFAGPLASRTLAAFGARVVKVESERRADFARSTGPFFSSSIDGSASYAHTNAGKWSIALDLTQPGATAVLHDLAAWADVIIDAYAPGALARMGLDEATVRRLNPSAVVLQTTMLGQTGPFASMPGYGNMAGALCGFMTTTAWPDLPPVGPAGAYTDMISPRFSVATVLAALDHRRRTGEGTWIDLGQGEACMQLLALGIADRQANGRGWEHLGNADHFAAPHGVYPCEERDTWVAIGCADDEQWRALCVVLDRPDLAPLDLRARQARHGEIDAFLERWTRGRTADAAGRDLQHAGVAAHAVQNSPECAADEQLVHRGWLTQATHSEHGTLPIGTAPIRLSRTPADQSTAGPLLGEHTMAVLSELLGYDDDQISDLVVSGIFR